MRVDRLGIALNEFLHRALLWLVIWHAQLLYRLFGLADVAVQVKDLDSLALGSLLFGWEGMPVQVATLTSRHRLSTCALAHRRRTGRVFPAFAGLRELVLPPWPFVCDSLTVAEYAPSLRRSSHRLPCASKLGTLRTCAGPARTRRGCRCVSSATHLHLAHGILPNIRSLGGAHILEELYLDHTKITAANLAVLVQHTPLLCISSLLHCEYPHTNLDFAHSLRLLRLLAITRSSLTFPLQEPMELQRALALTIS
ncbi:hypothetical protein LSCM1_03627 [Leishmania martiniquensis]|uniref:Leucine-rich repeat protein n=1 Tax=Leishmania martiniquensis TaxID=1580590 RepID=A0A836GUR6_9TRYP|nr:hypothetical protein LSCM1_03627 [Leishmania martiniquensis]